MPETPGPSPGGNPVGALPPFCTAPGFPVGWACLPGVHECAGGQWLGVSFWGHGAWQVTLDMNPEHSGGQRAQQEAVVAGEARGPCLQLCVPWLLHSLGDKMAPWAFRKRGGDILQTRSPGRLEQKTRNGALQLWWDLEHTERGLGRLAGGLRKTVGQLQMQTLAQPDNTQGYLSLRLLMAGPGADGRTEEPQKLRGEAVISAEGNECLGW